MRILTFCFLAGLLMAAGPAKAQKFWLLTYEFPHGPKTAIASKGDSFLVVGLANGIMISHNQGNSFTRTLDSPYIHSLYVTRTGKILAGTWGKIYYSLTGNNWDSVMFNHNYPFIDFTETDSGIFGITGEAGLANGYEGAGVFYSNNDGLTWTARNNGLGVYLGCQRIAHDKKNRLYVGCADENVSGNGGLFISENNALNWQHVPISFDGENSVPDNVKLEYVKGLNVTPEDSVWLSFTGTAVNVGVRLNLLKHINDIKTNSFWIRRKVFDILINWESDRLLQKIHFARNGDWYSSNQGSINSGATYFSKNRGINWRWHDEGLGLNEFGDRDQQFFTETTDGTVFMIQYFDERIYRQDTSKLTPTAIPGSNAFNFSLQPTITHAGYDVFIQFADEAARTIILTDLSGRAISNQRIGAMNYSIQMPDMAGLYFVSITQEKATITRKVIVKP